MQRKGVNGVRTATWNAQTDISKCKIANWKERLRNRADWEKCIEEGKVCIGL